MYSNSPAMSYVVPFHEKCKQEIQSYISRETSYFPIEKPEGRKVKSLTFSQCAPTSLGDVGSSFIVAGFIQNLRATLDRDFSSPEQRRDAILIETSAKEGYTFVSFCLYEREAEPQFWL